MAFHLVNLVFLISSIAMGGSISLGHRPLILIRGWGPSYVTQMQDVATFYIKNGMETHDIHEISYPYRKSPETIKNSIHGKLIKIFKLYPSQTKFDVISHSLGQFAGLYTILESGMADRFVIYAALAGDVHGQESIKHPGIGGSTVEALIPYMNPFIVGFLERHEKAIKNLKKCALYSLDDLLVTSPHDSGAFDDGINIELESVDHLDFIHSERVFNVLNTQCVFN